jgi:hypothetical protein
VAQAGRRADDLRVQPHRLEVAHAQAEIEQVGCAVGVLLAGKEQSLLGQQIAAWIGRHVRLGQVRRRLHAGMRMDIHRQAARTDFASRPAVLARGSVAVVVVRLGHRYPPGMVSLRGPQGRRNFLPHAMAALVAAIHVL